MRCAGGLTYLLVRLVDFRLVERRAVERRLLVLFIERLRLAALRLAVFLRGTLAPARRASDRPMAIACLRLVTLRRERPLFSVPRFCSCNALPTFFDALLLYFRMM
jgi:hypothetical protein